MQARRDALEKLLAPTRTHSTPTPTGSPPPLTPAIVLREHNPRISRNDSLQPLLGDESHKEPKAPLAVQSKSELPNPSQQNPVTRTSEATKADFTSQTLKIDEPEKAGPQKSLQQDLQAAVKTRTNMPEVSVSVDRPLVIKFTMLCLSCRHSFSSADRRRFDTAVDYHRAACDKKLALEFGKRNPD